MSFIKFFSISLILTTGLLNGHNAQASVCRGHFCGAVKNRTGRTMHITRTLAPTPEPGGGACDVWNWDGGPGSKFRHAGCSQQAWGNGTLGGNGTGDDIDAFTFNGEGYHERCSRVGSWHWRQKGVWTKVRDGEIADCGIGNGNGNEIWCTVLWQVP
jgi:hypothetical protein